MVSSVCGCAAWNPPSSPDPLTIALPSAWSGQGASSASETASLVGWWSRLNDAPLSSLVAQAMRSNTSVRQAQAALAQARALRDVSGAALWPSLGASLSAQRNRNTVGTGNSFVAGLDTAWELDVFGMRHAALDAASATALATSASLGDVQVSVAAEVALNYITLRATQARLTLTHNSLDTQLETLQLTRWREQAGLLSAVESEQAAAAAEQTRAQIPLLDTTLDQTLHALAVLSGQPPAALGAALREVGPMPQVSTGLALSLPAETLRQRADVRAAEWQAQAAWSRWAQASAARAPSFKLGGSVGLNALTLAGLGTGSTVVGSLLAAVSMPLLDGGAALAQSNAQQAAYEQARLGYQATVLTALKDVEDALVALRNDRARLSSLQASAHSASSAATLARQRYASGLVDFQTVLETQRSELSAQDSVITAQTSVSDDHVRLYKALGGGWQPDSRTPTP